jgi:hypothetical protein
MISYPVYKIVHFVGMFMLLSALGGLALHAAQGGGRSFPWKRKVALIHGLGMFFVLVGGFGMLARLGITGGLPGWIVAKLCIWLVLGSMMALLPRKPQWAAGLWTAIIVLGGLAAYLAGFKPV